MNKLVKKIGSCIKNNYKIKEDFDNYIFKPLNPKMGFNKGFMVFSKSEYDTNIAKKLKLGKYPYKKRYYYVEDINNINNKSVIFVLFNCSTSNPDKLDDTVKNCKWLATQKGYGRIEVLNLFSVRNANVNKIKSKDFKNDKDNFSFIIELLKARKNCDIVLAWGYGKEKEKVFIKNRIKDFIKELNGIIKENNINLLKISVNVDKIKPEIESKDRHPGNQAWAIFGGFRRAADLTEYNLK